MSGTSQKHRNFVSEPMGNKPVTALPGVGRVTGGRLKEAGYYQAKAVLGEYLVSNGDRGQFQRWMTNTAQANSKQVNDCYQSLNTWTNEFL